MIWADWVFVKKVLGEECFADLGFGQSHELLRNLNMGKWGMREYIPLRLP